MWLQLKDELPRFGSGLRRVDVVQVGRKWVKVTCHGISCRVSSAMWAELRRRAERDFQDERSKAMSKILDTDYTEMNLAQLLDHYNAIAVSLGVAKRNAKFPDKPTALKRVAGLIVQARAVKSGGAEPEAPKKTKVPSPTSRSPKLGPDAVLRLTPAGKERKCRPDTETAAVWAKVKDGMTLAQLEKATEGVEMKFPARAHVSFSVRHGFLTVA
jgi:hypothetical protein